MTRYGFSMKVDCDNAAFVKGGNRATEIARILRSLADAVERRPADINNGQRADGWLFDLNGNNCGTWEAKPRRIRD